MIAVAGAGADEWTDVDDHQVAATTTAHFQAAVLLNLAGRRFNRARNALRDAELGLGHALDRAEAARADFIEKCDEVERAARLYVQARALR